MFKLREGVEFTVPVSKTGITQANSTTVMVDPTGHDPNHGHVLVTLDHVMPQNLHAANIWT